MWSSLVRPKSREGGDLGTNPCSVNVNGWIVDSATTTQSTAEGHKRTQVLTRRSTPNSRYRLGLIFFLCLSIMGPESEEERGGVPVRERERERSRRRRRRERENNREKTTEDLMKTSRDWAAGCSGWPGADPPWATLLKKTLALSQCIPVKSPMNAQQLAQAGLSRIFCLFGGPLRPFSRVQLNQSVFPE